MNKLFVVCLITAVPIMVGCTNVRSVLNSEKDASVSWQRGEYHAAMRELPKAMAEWTEYTERTGNTAEGAAGYLFSTTMFRIAEKGDMDWGSILDDPEIPYNYKIEMLFEILELRLGKGSVYMGNDSNLIVPVSGPIDLKDMIKLPD